MQEASLWFIIECESEIRGGWGSIGGSWEEWDDTEDINRGT